MKNKTQRRRFFTVNYNTTTSYDTVVQAANVEEAKKKVIEVIGYPIKIESAWELDSTRAKEWAS